MAEAFLRRRDEKLIEEEAQFVRTLREYDERNESTIYKDPDDALDAVAKIAAMRVDVTNPMDVQQRIEESVEESSAAVDPILQWTEQARIELEEKRWSKGFTQIALELGDFRRHEKVVWYRDSAVIGTQVKDACEFNYEGEGCKSITMFFSANLKNSKVYVGRDNLFIVDGHQVEWASWATGMTQKGEIENTGASETDGDLYFAVATQVLKFNPDDRSMETVLNCGCLITDLLVQGDTAYTAAGHASFSVVHVWSLSTKEKICTSFNVGRRIMGMYASADVLCVQTNDRTLLLYVPGSPHAAKKIPFSIGLVCGYNDGTFFGSRYNTVDRCGLDSVQTISLSHGIIDMSLSQSGKLGVIVHGPERQFLCVNEA